MREVIDWLMMLSVCCLYYVPFRFYRALRSTLRRCYLQDNDSAFQYILFGELLSSKLIVLLKYHSHLVSSSSLKHYLMMLSFILSKISGG